MIFVVAFIALLGASGFRSTPRLLFLAVIIGLAVSGRNVPYPGAYLKPYKRL